MKKNILVCVLLLFSVFLFGQTPNKMSYQAVIRNATSDLVTNKEVSVRISILNENLDGTPIYVESHNPTTNSNGLLSLKIGEGNVLNGDFSSIKWSKGKYYIKTETDITGGVDYAIVGVSQLLSVPYALHAKTAEFYDEKITTLEQDNVTGEIVYTDESGKQNNIKILSTDADNNLEIGSDGGLLLRSLAPIETEPWRDINGNPATNTSSKINFMGGNVGIGTTNPYYKLMVNSDINATALFESSVHSIARIRTTATDKIAGLYFQNPEQQYSFYLSSNNNFYLRDITNAKTILTAKSNGNIGIGTTNPYYKLMVKSDINATALFESSAHSIARIHTTATDKIAALYFKNPRQQYAWYLGTDDSLKLLNTTENKVTLTAKKDGNIGIGTTNPTQKLEVTGVAQFGANSATFGGVQMYGRYSGKNHINTYGSERGTGATTIGYAVQPKSGATGYVSSTENIAFSRGLLKINGGLQFSTAKRTLVNIGNNVTLTPRFTVLNNGNVGVGTTAPREKLEVKGNIKTSGSLQLGVTRGVVVGSVCTSSDAGKIVFNGSHFCACDGSIWKQVD